MRVLGRSRRGSALGAVSIGILIFALATLLTLSACGSDEPTATAIPEPTATSAPDPTATSAPDPTPEPTEEPTPEPTEAPAARTEPVELFDMDVRNIDGWINSEPTSIAQLTSEGKVVLVDFWTYTCVNCLRTLPFLREWQDKYADNGLVILGVHAPEFEFEKELENVQMSVDDEGIEWPVALDNEMSTWRSFNNRYWPAKYLIDTNGEVRYTHFGEGAYRETELEIRHVLEESGYDVSGIPIGEVENTSRDDTARSVTRELYGGLRPELQRLRVVCGAGRVLRGSGPEVEYEDIYAERNSYPPQKFVLKGLWRNEQEAIVHARETMDLSDYIALRFHGRSANVVIDPPEPDEFKVYVELDGRWLMENEAGDDILFDDEGRSYFNVDEGRMYKIVETPEYVEDTLKLSSDSPNFAIFAFTFGTYDGGF